MHYCTDTAKLQTNDVRGNSGPDTKRILEVDIWHKVGRTGTRTRVEGTISVYHKVSKQPCDPHSPVVVLSLKPHNHCFDLRTDE